MNKKYIIGLDLGVNNVVGSVVDAETNKLESYGVRRFNTSDGASNRRIARNTRRRLKRKDTRKEDILKRLLKKFTKLSINYISSSFYLI